MKMDVLLPLLISLLLLCGSFAIIFLTNKGKVRPLRLPPGKTGWPILGETLQFLLSGRKGRLEEFVHTRREKYSPEVFTTSLFGHNMAFFCSASGNKFLFASENKLVTSWWPQTISKILMDPSISRDSTDKKLKFSRSVILDFLKPDALRNYIPTMDLVAREQIATEWAPKREVVVLDLARKYTFWLACRLLMGIQEPENVAKLMNHFEAVVAGILSVPIDFPGTTFNQGIKKARFLRKELLSIIKATKTSLEERKDKCVKDIITHVLLLPPDENVNFRSDVIIADLILGLLIGGYDTTATTITFLIKYLAELPHVYQQVLKEHTEIAKCKGPKEFLNWGDIQKMKYSWNVACEVLRLVPPSQIGFKEAIADFTFAGFTIPKGWKTCWSVHSTHKNPNYFSNPEKFDPTRFEGNGPAPYTFVPFGGGPRMCPGKEFARVEILVFLHNLVTKFKWEKINPNEKTVFTPIPVPQSGLPVRLWPIEN
ncbi:hypothetical protein NMG60_11030053 [Bertholletia excelsa]